MPVPPDRADIRYERVRRVRSFEEVVDQIRDSIASGTLAVGERLPSERELAEMFGVSRPTLREALRALEALGLLDIRLGSQGGAYAVNLDEERLTSVLFGLFASHGATRPADLQAFRATHHADNAYWAASRDDAHFPHVRAGALKGEAEFLSAVALATEDPLRRSLTDALEHAVAERGGASVLSIDAREAIAARIVAGDAQGACRLMHAELSWKR